jgi:pyruvate, water dikinase
MTELMVNVASSSAARRAAALPVQGVGLMRGEFLFYSLGEHPHALLASGSTRKLIDALHAGIREVAEAFYPRKVVYRLLDFKSNEMRSLAGGVKYEPIEENPALGLRGCSRYAHDPEVFAAELAAIAQVRTAGLDNVHIMVPFVRLPAELAWCREQFAAAGLNDVSLELWAMAEVPASLYLLAEFAPFIHGISIGTNDLTQLLFGVDRDNPQVSSFYDDGHPVVVQFVCSMVAAARTLGLHTSVCGDIVSRNEDFVRALVRAGVDSISVSSDAVHATLASITAAGIGQEAS